MRLSVQPGTATEQVCVKFNLCASGSITFNVNILLNLVRIQVRVDTLVCRRDARGLAPSGAGGRGPPHGGNGTGGADATPPRSACRACSFARRGSRAGHGAAPPPRLDGPT